MEANGTRLDEQRFPGRQGRIVFAYLAVQKGRPVPRDELAEMLWGEELPATWEKALRVLMTKLRALLEECGIDGAGALTSAFGCYQLTLPPDAWIDVEAAASGVERAEADLAAGRFDDARAEAAAAAELARRSFLPGEDGSWVEEQRRDLRDLLLRALECLRDASFAAGKFGDALRYANEITELEPFRESSYRALMQAHAAAGNPAEALRVYERCRRFLSEELGIYPSPETEAVYLEILRSPPGQSESVDQPGEETPRDELPAPVSDSPPRRGRRRVTALTTATVVVAVAAAAVGLAFASHHKARAPVVLRPNSLVRIDSETLKPTLDVPIGRMADLVVAKGGYVWVNHWSLRYTNDAGLHNGGDRVLTRFTPSTGRVDNLGLVAPCGITPDPSGDLWVANCYPGGNGSGNVQRVHARTMQLDPPVEVPTVDGYYRGMAYGGGSLWLGGVNGLVTDRRLIQFDPQTGKKRTIYMDRQATALAWSPGYGDLWMSNFGDSSVSQLHSATKTVTTPFEYVSNDPGPVAVGDDGAMWVGNWDPSPTTRVTRLPADGSGLPQRILLPPAKFGPGGTPSIAAGAGGIWVAVPDDHAVWRIDPLHPTRPPKRIFLHYAPWGVTVDNGAIWVTLRGSTTSVTNN